MASSNRFIVVAICLLATTALTQAADYRFLGGYQVPGNDIACGQKDEKKENGTLVSYCLVCEEVAGVAAACDRNPECMGFDMTRSMCGYLKKASGQGKVVAIEQPGKARVIAHYCKVGAGSNCIGNYTMKPFADIQGKNIDCNDEGTPAKKVEKSDCFIPDKSVGMAAQCDANPQCKAFTTSVGHIYVSLKNVSGPTSWSVGVTTYIKG